MRLTDEQIRFIKSKGLRNGYDNPNVSAVIFNLCDTIEALQQEIEQLQELAKTKAEGRLVELPCKVEDTVWYIEQGRIISGVVDGYLWFRSCGFALNVVWNEPIMEHFGYRRKEMPFSYIGKIVFLTREAAEIALKKVMPHEPK